VRLTREAALAAGALTWEQAVDAYEEARLWGHYAVELSPVPHLVRYAAAVQRWRRQQATCTPAGRAPPAPAPAPGPHRRIVVLVGGLNSSSESAAIDDVDTGGLGYAPGDAVRFSYAGGRVPDPGDAVRTPTATAYGPEHTTADLRDSAATLVELLGEIHREAPGVPVDVIAHSQGGVVARLAMDAIDPLDPGAPDVGTLITLGAPHHGANLATGADLVGRSDVGALGLTAAGRITGMAVGAGGDAVSPGQLSQTSALVDDLAGRAVPDHVRIVSIAARGDLVVPAGRSHLAGAANTIVGLDGVSAHDRLPGSPEAAREMALALAGMAPTCEAFDEMVADVAVSEGIAMAEDAASVILSLAARRLDQAGPP
jgi:hypothetical protein